MIDLLVDKTVIGTIGGVVVGFALSELREYMRRAVLNFTDIELYNLDKSVRVVLPVRHAGGSLPVNNASGYLTIYLRTNGKMEKYISEDILIEKLGSSCSIACGLCNYKNGDLSFSKPYLAQYPKAKIASELLPWTVPLEAGRGLDGFEYKHLTNIPVDGIAKLVLFDIYKATKAGEQFYLIKVHSEYGTEYYPRVCLKLPIRRGWNGELVFDIKVSGENVRKQAKAQVKIVYDDIGHYLLEYYVEGKLRKNFHFDAIMKDKESTPIDPTIPVEM